MPPTGTPDLLSRGRQTWIMVDYKFIIECERSRRRRRRHRRKYRIHLRASHGNIFSTRFRKVTKSNEFVLETTRIW